MYTYRSYIWPYSMVEAVSCYRYVSNCELRKVWRQLPGPELEIGSVSLESPPMLDVPSPELRSSIFCNLYDIARF